MNSLARTWLRRIAFGLPLATISLPISGCPYTSGCGDDWESMPQRTFTITSEQRAMIVSDAGGADGGISCAELCSQLDMEFDFAEVSACQIDDSGVAPAITCTWDNYCVGGRRPAGLLGGRARAISPVGRFLADCARLEAASVPAFADLARELALHGAPSTLTLGAQRAEADEVRHARQIARLAGRFGARPAPVARAATTPRSLREIAEDNAVEGCAREAYAALLAARQSLAAPDASIAKTYAGVARDEARHALWSFALHAWASSELPSAQARAIEERRRASIAELAHRLEHESDPELRAVLGVPDAERAVEMAQALA